MNELMQTRREKLAAWRKQAIAFPSGFHRHQWTGDLLKQYSEYSDATLTDQPIAVTIAGRMMLKRVMGKVSFAHLQDGSGRIQIYVRCDKVGDVAYSQFQEWDLGDIIGVTGALFKTKTGELSVKASTLILLTKSLRPLPDKFHGLTDQEMRYRQRYLDLMMNEETRRLFEKRSQIIDVLRVFFKDRQYLEVETPMMQTLVGGAAAKPFITHHHALGMPLYLRIAPELYLKRLVVGGLERVFEINRNFRNEGLSTQHNPEFTMLEFYQAYADYHDLMNLTEQLFQVLAQALFGKPTFTYQGVAYDMSRPFERLTLKEAILKYHPQYLAAQLEDESLIKQMAAQLNVPIQATDSVGKIQVEIFEKTIEKQLIQPTFITAYPRVVSPLARCNDRDASVTDRFELFIAGREIANGFSELNDPEDQAERFREQVLSKKAGDEEAMPYDEDYITALEYGLPPTAGEGIGIDRLVMLLTDAPSIRDVILFPQMRKLQLSTDPQHDAHG